MIVKFEWRELKHKRTGQIVAGCWAWHFMDQPMCDHEHDEEERSYTCEDAVIEMSNIRARMMVTR